MLRRHPAAGPPRFPVRAVPTFERRQSTAMYVFLSKLLPLLVLPVSVVLCLLLAGTITRRRSFLIASALVLYLSSIPLVSQTLTKTLETAYVRIAASEAPSADAIVVLSGGRVVAPGPAAISEWSDADRFFGGVELFQAGKAPLLVFTGGWFPYAPSAPLEGDILKGYAMAFGVPPERVLVTGRVVNTFEEAQATSALLNQRSPPASRILLVTSAFHMDRATTQFERAGLTVLPYPVDFGVTQAHTFSVLDLLPNGAALARTQVALREVYGRTATAVSGMVF